MVSNFRRNEMEETKRRIVPVDVAIPLLSEFIDAYAVGGFMVKTAMVQDEATKEAMNGSMVRVMLLSCASEINELREQVNAKPKSHGEYRNLVTRCAAQGEAANTRIAAHKEIAASLFLALSKGAQHREDTGREIVLTLPVLSCAQDEDFHETCLHLVALIQAESELAKQVTIQWR
jgi:hypothetical protein